MTRHSLRAACLLAILCLVTAPAVAEKDPRSDFDRDFSRTLPVKPGQKLDVEHSQGAVRITVQKGSEVRVKARITVSSSDADGAQKFGEGIVVTAEDTGGAIVVRTRYPEKKWTFSGTGHVSFSVDYDILVPETMPVTVRNKFGDINVDGLKADATLSTTNGRVAFHDGKGTLRIDTSFGAIEVVRNAGPVDVTGANGSIVVAEIGGPAVIRNRFGSISVRNIQGKTEISGGNGSIEVSNVTGDLTVTNSFGTVATTAITGDVSIRNNNGEVTLDGVSGAADVEGSFGKIRASKIKKSLRVRAQNGEVSASDENANGAVRASAVQGAASVRTSFSQVLLAGVGGRVDVDNSNGSIEVHAAPAKAGACAPMSLKNSFGPIRVFLPEGAGYTVDASTSFGKLRTELPLTITDSPSSPNASSLRGRIGDGKCPLTIADSNGNIELQKAK
jgi:hypothetical protein